MPFSTVIQENETGIALIVTVLDRYTKQPKDISDAVNIKFLLRKGNGPTLSFPGTFVNDGRDGNVQYILQTGDLNVSGNWFIQISYMINSYQRYTSEDVFVVAPNLI